MESSKQDRGIGVVVAIFIIAIVALGGFAAVQISKKSAMNAELGDANMIDEMDEEIIEAKQDVRTSLANLKSKLNVSGSVDASLNAIADVKAELGSAYVNADAEAKAEFAEIMTRLDKLEADIAAGADSAMDSLDAVIETITISLDEETSVDMNTDTEAEMEGEVNVDESASTDDSESETSVEATSNTEVMVDDMTTSGNLDAAGSLIVE